jgi:hypothetical protein
LCLMTGSLFIVKFTSNRSNLLLPLLPLLP